MLVMMGSKGLTATSAATSTAMSALATEGCELLGEAWQHGPRRVGAAHDNGLLGLGLEDFLGQPASNPRREPEQTRAEPSQADGFHRCRCRVFLEEIQDSWVVEVRTQNPLQRGVDLHQKPPDPVTRGGHLAHKVVVESAEQRQLGDLLVLEADCPQSMWKRPGRFGDDRSVAGIGLRFAGVQISDAPHR